MRHTIFMLNGRDTMNVKEAYKQITSGERALETIKGQQVFIKWGKGIVQVYGETYPVRKINIHQLAKDIARALGGES